MQEMLRRTGRADGGAQGPLRGLGWWGKDGVQDNIYGWQIDDLSHLRLMQHGNNVSKGDDDPSYICAITSEGNWNKYYDGPLTVKEATRTVLAELYQF